MSIYQQDTIVVMYAEHKAHIVSGSMFECINFSVNLNFNGFELYMNRKTWFCVGRKSKEQCVRYYASQVLRGPESTWRTR